MGKTAFKRLKSILLLILIVSLILPVTACKKEEPSIYAANKNWVWWREGEDKKADLFLITPTAVKGSETSFNLDMDSEQEKARLLGAANMQKGIYMDSCRLYCPYYRQATISSYEKGEAKMGEDLDIAYEDVREAFLYYMKHENKGRPIVLAGFSQGSQHLLRLMKEFFGEKKYADKLVAAYAIGWRLTEDEVKEYPQLKPAKEEDDTGVIISFNSEAPSVTDSMLVPKGTKTYAINPLNWKIDSTQADKSQNKGACFPAYSGIIKLETPKLCGAYLDEERGTLKVPDISPVDYPPGLSMFEEGVYHLYDYQLFYRNLQENVDKRVKAF